MTDPVIGEWGAAVWGDVLEVGLGAGHLAREIAGNNKVTTHTIIERDDSLRCNCPASAKFVHGKFPVRGTQRYDCITLDYPGFDFSHFKWCLAHLVEGGALFVRIVTR